MRLFMEILPYVQMALALLLVVGILMQQSDASLGAVFGGGNDAGGAKRTRRGLERTLFIGTIVVAVLFVLSSIVVILI